MSDNKTLVKKLKETTPSTFNENDLILQRILVDLVGTLEDRPNSLVQGVTEFTNNIMATYEDAMSPFRYFSGNGPIAHKLRDHFTVLEHLYPDRLVNIRMEHEEIKRELFDFQVVTDPEKLKALADLIVSVSRGFTDNPPLFHLPTNRLVFSDVFEWETGVYPHIKTMVLHAEFGEVRFSLSIDYDGRTQMAYYHPGEDVWMLTDTTFLLDGMLERIQEQYSLLANQHDLSIHPPRLDELDALRLKADETFMRRQQLPSQAEFWNAVHPDYTTICIPISTGQVLNFIDTRGQYPSREMYLTNVVGKTEWKVSFEELHPFTQQLVIREGLEALETIGTRTFSKKRAPVFIPSEHEHA